MNVFVDTSFFIARTHKRDQWHQRAIQVSTDDMSLYTSSPIVNETATLMQARGYFSQALVFLGEVRSNNLIEIVYPDAVLQAVAWERFGRWGAMGANAVDCLSFALMESLSIREALTFDEHFRMAGYSMLPEEQIYHN